LKQLDHWRVEDNKFLIKTFSFANFVQALELANKFGALAEKEGHHPDLLVRWGALEVKIWTHAVNGLTESDFILAAKMDKIVKKHE
jgi:4a-hydroxytetrahydrobiopterin dehydratase